MDRQGDPLGGLVTRAQLLELPPFKGRSVKTILRYEAGGMPVIRRGTIRLYDLDAVVAWLRGDQQRSRRRVA
jgi:phage terminase Nu1 subunit (DNA packaging protein)